MLSTNNVSANRIKVYFEDWTKWEKLWISSFTFLILALSLVWGDNIIGIAVSISGIWCVVLVAKGRISNYWIGIPNVIGYAYLAYGWQYYGEVMLNLLFFLPMQFIGWYQWTRPSYRKSQDEVNVKFLNTHQRISVVGLSTGAVIGYGFFLKSIGGALPFIDAISTVLSIIAMILMVKAYMEQWLLWIFVNIVSIILWVTTLINGGSDITILLMWTAYLVNAVYGWRNWIKLYREQETSS